jgi:hypothetical protein
MAAAKAVRLFRAALSLVPCPWSLVERLLDSLQVFDEATDDPACLLRLRVDGVELVVLDVVLVEGDV